MVGGFTALKGIVTERSRCLRMRLNGNSCDLCITRCRSKAITIDDDIHVRADLCSLCMLCVSECPSACFKIQGGDFNTVIEGLRNIRVSVTVPVLGCGEATGAASHLRTYCFGLLSEEHILALAAFLDDPVQLNVTGCGDCRNGFVLAVLQQRMENIETKTGLEVSEKIRLVQHKTELFFQETTYSRRGFFNALRHKTLRHAAGVLDNCLSKDKKLSYSNKKLPFRRKLLNRALGTLPERFRRPVLENYYCDIVVNDDCDRCFSCIGMCPTGALKIENGEGMGTVFFSSALCIECRLCEDFCRQKSTRVIKGFHGEDPFPFSDTTRALPHTDKLFS